MATGALPSTILLALSWLLYVCGVRAQTCICMCACKCRMSVSATVFNCSLLFLLLSFLPLSLHGDASGPHRKDRPGRRLRQPSQKTLMPGATAAAEAGTLAGSSMKQREKRCPVLPAYPLQQNSQPFSRAAMSSWTYKSLLPPRPHSHAREQSTLGIHVSNL